MNESFRAFVAIKVSDQVASGLLDLQAMLRKRLAGVAIKWCSREQMHITLQFLGNVPADRLNELTQALGGACRGTSVLNLTVSVVGAFPNLDRPRVIWAGVSGDVVSLCNLQHRVASAAAGFGDHAEERDFHPHLTLGRLSHRSGGDELAVARTIGAVPPLQIGGWQAKSVFLIRSRLAPSGAVYTDLGQFPLVTVE